MAMSHRFGLLLVVGLLTVMAAPAHANQVPGATYTGTAATGGTVSFDISPLGGNITRFAWTGVPTDCGILSGSFTGSTPIVDHAFDLFTQQPGRPVSFAGSFPANQQATGTLSTPGRGGGGCNAVGWTATTTAIAPRPPTRDELAPAIDAGARLGRDGAVNLRVRCPEEACHLTARGTVSIAGGGKAFRLRPYFRPSVSPDRTVRVAPELGRRGLAAVRRALRKGRGVRAMVAVTAVYAARIHAVERSTIRFTASTGTTPFEARDDESRPAPRRFLCGRGAG